MYVRPSKVKATYDKISRNVRIMNIDLLFGKL